jgi:hypothetical protein
MSINPPQEETMTADLTITATVITQSGVDLTPVAVQVRGTGMMPTPAIRAIAAETLMQYAVVNEDAKAFKVEAEPSFHEQAEDTVTFFPVFKSLTGRK